MKAPTHVGRRRRAPIKLTPQELAWAREDALRWRAALRAERAGEVAEPPGATAPDLPVAWEEEQRARFATAIARAEFGRFYHKDGHAKGRKKRKAKGKSARHPARNGKGPS